MARSTKRQQDAVAAGINVRICQHLRRPFRQCLSDPRRDRKPMDRVRVEVHRVPPCVQQEARIDHTNVALHLAEGATLELPDFANRKFVVEEITARIVSAEPNGHEANLSVTVGQRQRWHYKTAAKSAS